MAWAMAGGPAAHVGHGRQQQPQGDGDADRPGHRAHHPVDLAQGADREAVMERRPEQEPEGLADEAGADEGGGDDEELVARRRTLQGVHHVGQEVGRHRQADHQADP
jgi:hypothetical protein